MGKKGNNFNEINEDEMDLFDDFIFSENDTIGTLLHSEYRQDQALRYLSVKQELNQQQSHIFEKQQKLETINVKHLIDIQGVRFLYTKKVLEMIHHHFFKGFDYKQFKPRKHHEQEENYESRNIFLDYDNTMAGRSKGN